jgi:hypothetical protein
MTPEREAQAHADLIAALPEREREYRWTGVKPNLAGAAGSMSLRPADLSAIVRDRYEQGWQSLSVTSEGTEVAAIVRSASPPHKRTWRAGP